MFGGIGKILKVVRAIAPFAQFIPALAPFVKLFQITDQVANLVKNFKSGFSFLDTIAKFAPMPKGFDLAKIGGCFGLDAQKISGLQSFFDGASKAFKAFETVSETTNNSNFINSSRMNAIRSGFVSLSS